VPVVAKLINFQFSKLTDSASTGGGIVTSNRTISAIKVVMVRSQKE
jgi:hypothetical protein